ncbi:8278_t:CDS:2 [Entrophospora sp. SA101]|nr:13126_t:CDS:2 [Entrophospora sp. SA101]CAJ0831554.1 13134_t:CDS:2 [Entrophospora sp. SA101]CAJ0838644.1 11702_t:CDS:2 [Entrophospora sp. SA101]CAJ0908007.1 21011_t:CDS:2 [Entrophospora sp. SA101]CAJ0908023.1 8278_t:CDS:2 [Entrophospora sp. SA101]
MSNKKGENANLDFNSWAENPRLKKVPQQKNSYDCGVFTLASLNTLEKIIYEIASGELLT